MQALLFAFQGNQNIHRWLIYCSYALHEFSKALKPLALVFPPLLMTSQGLLSVQFRDLMIFRQESRHWVQRLSIKRKIIMW